MSADEVQAQNLSSSQHLRSSGLQSSDSHKMCSICPTEGPAEKWVLVMTRLFPAACLPLVMLTSTWRPTGRRLSTLLSSDYPQQTQFTPESKQDYPVTLWVRGKELYPSLMFYCLSKSITFNPQVSSKLKLRRSGCRGRSGCQSVTGPMLFRSGATNQQKDKLFKKHTKQTENFPSRDNWLLGLCRDQHKGNSSKAWRKCGLVLTAEIL